MARRRGRSPRHPSRRPPSTSPASCIVDEITNKQRNRVFAYRTHLDILSEGTEPLR